MKTAEELLEGLPEGWWSRDSVLKGRTYWIAGGWCRDKWFGMESKDVDVFKLDFAYPNQVVEYKGLSYPIQVISVNAGIDDEQWAAYPGTFDISLCQIGVWINAKNRLKLYTSPAFERDQEKKICRVEWKNVTHPTRNLLRLFRLAGRGYNFDWDDVTRLFAATAAGTDIAKAAMIGGMDFYREFVKTVKPKEVVKIEGEEFWRNRPTPRETPLYTSNPNPYIPASIPEMEALNQINTELSNGTSESSRAEPMANGAETQGMGREGISRTEETNDLLGRNPDTIRSNSPSVRELYEQFRTINRVIPTRAPGGSGSGLSSEQWTAVYNYDGAIISTSPRRMASPSQQPLPRPGYPNQSQQTVQPS